VRAGDQAGVDRAGLAIGGRKAAHLSRGMGLDKGDEAGQVMRVKILRSRGLAFGLSACAGSNVPAFLPTKIVCRVLERFDVALPVRREPDIDAVDAPSVA